jgi:hypothetical protein
MKIIKILLMMFILMNHQFVKADQLNLSDLGISSEVKQDLQLEQDLKERSSKLYIHQVTGLVTAGLMVASLVTAQMVTDNNAHQILGMTTAAAYWTTFYFSQTAPKISGAETKGWNIKIHKASRWIHAPLMALVPIVGLIANHQVRHGEETHGLGSLKGGVGGAAAASYLLGASVMFFEF